MILSRRGFLAGIIAAGMAPAIVRAGIIMPIKPQLIVAPPPLIIERGGLILMSREKVDLLGTASVSYFWARSSLLGEPDPENIARVQAQGWMPVLENERPDLVSKGIISPARPVS